MQAMDVLVDIVAFIIRALVERPDSNRQRSDIRQPPQPRGQPPARRAQAGTLPLASLTKSSSQDPVYDDGGWRLAVNVLALIALIVMVAVWFAYTRGWLSPG